MGPYRKPTQVDEASSLRGTSETSLRNSAKKLGVTSGDALPAPLLILKIIKIMWIIYLIQHNKTKQIYIGVTSNLRRRLAEHNQDKQTTTHRKRGSWVLVYAEVYRSKNDALKREKKLKHHGSAKHALKRRIQQCYL